MLGNSKNKRLSTKPSLQRSLPLQVTSLMLITVANAVCRTKDCRFLGQNKCGICERFSHKTEDCYSRKVKELKCKRETNAERSGNKKKRFGDKSKKEEANEGEVMDDKDDDEHIVFTTREAGTSKIMFDPSEEGINFNDPDVSNSNEYDERLIFYN